MTRATTNVAASIRQRLLNVAKERGEPFDYVLSLYARERFLVRLGHSAHRGRLILKGATVFAIWLHEQHRTTRDLDFLGTGQFDPNEAERVIAEVCATSVEADGVTFDSSAIRTMPIRAGDEYQGIRVHIEAHLAGARIRVQLDIGLGDVVTPPAVLDVVPAILPDLASPRVKVYPPETIVAEKLHAIVTLGIANSRMKDFFDLYVIAREKNFEGELLATAVERTFRRRKTQVPRDPIGLAPEFFDDPEKGVQWRAFLSRTGAAAPAELARVGVVLRRFLLPVLEAVHSGSPLTRRWSGGRWRAKRVQ